MGSVRVIDDPRQAAALASPVRRRILLALGEPGSASSVARALGIPRQVAAYHVRQLEAHGHLELVRQERRRGCLERIVRRTARYLVASNAVFGEAGLDPEAARDHFSAQALLALAERVTREVAAAQTAAESKQARLATLAANLEVRFRGPAERQAFAEELLTSVAQLAAKYHDEHAQDGRSYRVVLGAYPLGKKP